MGRWVKMREELDGHPNVIAIAAKLRLSEDAVLGKLFRLWLWANKHAKDDFAKHVGAAFIDAHSRQSGFAESVCAVGWIDITPLGTRFIDFGKHNFQASNQKALTAERVRQHRGRKKRTCNAAPLPNALPELRTKNHIPPYPLPFDSPAFRDAWSSWERHRKAKRAALTDETVRRQFRKLAAMGEARAIATIEHSIEKGWTGLFEPDGPAPPSDADTGTGLFTPVRTVADAAAEYEHRRKGE